jgi:hypothetical protein
VASLLTSLLVWLVGSSSVVFEPPTFWAAVANDPGVDAATRRSCVMRLVDRHATPGMTLADFARLLDKPNWLKMEDFTNCNEAFLGGYIPVEIHHKINTTFCFRVLPEPNGEAPAAVYFRVSGQVTTDACFQVMRGLKPECLANVTVLELATSGGREGCHRKALSPH